VRSAAVEAESSNATVAVSHLLIREPPLLETRPLYRIYRPSLVLAAPSLSPCGLAFKANVDDLRESPALEIAHRLAARYGPRIRIVEPNVHKLPSELARHGVKLVHLEEALQACQVAILLVDHDQFRMVPLAERRHLAVLDTRGIWRDMPGRA
jgi:UDP-N-acetyl-D-mannosaminuronate dehydrogenase